MQVQCRVSGSLCKHPFTQMAQRAEMFIRSWKGFLWNKKRGMFSGLGWSFPWTCSCGYEKSSPGDNVNSMGPLQRGQSFTLRLRAQGKAEFPRLWQTPAPHSLAIRGCCLWTQWLMGWRIQLGIIRSSPGLLLPSIMLSLFTSASDRVRILRADERRNC